VAAASAAEAAETAETTKAGVTAEAAETAKTKSKSQAAEPELAILVRIVLGRIPRGCFGRLEITDIQHLQFIVEIIHLHTSIVFCTRAERNPAGQFA
jgi:hypothetical protein